MCSSGQSLSISQGGVGAKSFESILGMLRRPFGCSARSMLCVPAYVHREVLDLGKASDSGKEAAVVPVLVQWANAQGRPFSRADLLVASSFTNVLGRLAGARSMLDSQALLEER